MYSTVDIYSKLIDVSVRLRDGKRPFILTTHSGAVKNLLKKRKKEDDGKKNT